MQNSLRIIYFQSTALLDTDLSDDVSCVRRIYLETAQLSGFSVTNVRIEYVMLFWFGLVYECGL